jgi:hydrogenase maturation protease
VADLLRAAPPPGVDLLEVPGDCTALLAAWAGVDAAIVVDAVCSGAPAGTVHEIDGLHESPLPPPGHSTHGIGVAAAVALGRALGGLPPVLSILGIEGADFRLGAAVSPLVARAAADVAARIRDAVGQA